MFRASLNSQTRPSLYFSTFKTIADIYFAASINKSGPERGIQLVNKINKISKCFLQTWMTPDQKSDGRIKFPDLENTRMHWKTKSHGQNKWWKKKMIFNRESIKSLIASHEPGWPLIADWTVNSKSLTSKT